MVLEILSDINVLSFLLFILALAVIIIYDRKKVRLEGIVFIRRTLFGRKFIDNVAKRSPRGWDAVGTIGIIVAIPLLILGSVFLINQAIAVTAGEGEGGVRLLLPGPVSDPLSAPGIFVVPWWIWVIGIAIVIIPHEFMHGIMCRIENIRISSVGWILLVIIPGAFVEPDEKQLKRAPRKTKLKVYAAGSFANVITAMIVLLIMMGMFAYSFAPAGIFVNTIEGGPANLSGLTGTITEIDGVAIRTVDDIVLALQLHKPGDVVSVTAAENNMITPRFTPSIDFFIPKPAVATDFTEIKTYEIMLSENDGRAFLGIAPVADSFEYQGSGSFETYRIITILLIWIFIFSLGIGIVNLLPIKPLDGGLILEEIAGAALPPHARKITIAVSLIMLAFLVFNIIGGALV